MINFPSNPTTGDVYSFQGRIWRWNGVSWRTIASSYSGNIIILGGSSGNVVSVNGQTGVVTLSTANITEQGNLYFTNARVYANIIGLGYATNTYVNTRLDTKANITDLTTSNIVEGSNLYFTNTRAISAFTSGSGISIASNGRITSTVAGGGNVDSVNGLTGTILLTTANISEQSNLYFTNTRVYANVIELGYATNTYVNSRLLSKANVSDLTTSNVVETANLYFTNTRAVYALTAGAGITIASNGRITSTVTGGGGGGNVDSVNGLTGAVVLTTANVFEDGNLYFTNNRVYSNIIALDYSTNTYVNTRLETKANVADLTTANLLEEGNLYYTDSRVYDNVSLIGYVLSSTFDACLSVKANTFDLSTAIVFEDGNLYYTDDRVYTNVLLLDYSTNTYVNERLVTKANITDLTTSNIIEGSNLYFTNARVYANVIALDYSTNTYVNSRLNTKANIGDLTTANVYEDGNLYFTNTRVYANVIALDYSTNTYVNSRLNTKANINDLNTSNIVEGSNLYFTNTRVLSYLQNIEDNVLPALDLTYNLGSVTRRWKDLYLSGNTVYLGNALIQSTNESVQLPPGSTITGQTTDNVAEGNVNVYFTNTRARAALLAGTGVTYDTLTGAISIGQNVSPTRDVTFANLVVTGNLLVQGNAIEFASNTLVINDPLIQVGKNPVSDTVDLGFFGHYIGGNPSIERHAGLFRDATDGQFKLFTNLDPEPVTLVDTANTSYQAANLVVNYVVGKVTDISNHTTSSLTEGSNLYFTNARVYANVVALDYSANTYVETRLLTKANVNDLTTTNVIEGANLYFTNTRAVSAFTGGTGIVINSNGLVVSTVSSSNPYGDDNVYSNVNLIGFASNTYVETRLLTKANINDLTTSNVIEGSNLYFTNDRVYANVISLDYSTNTYVNTRLDTKANVADLTTSNIIEDGNLYFTNDRVYANVISLDYSTNSYVNTRLLSKANVADLTTTNVIEGANLYFTNTRAISAFTSGTGISIAANGQITSTATGGGGSGTVTDVFGQTVSVSNAQLACATITSGVLNTDNVIEGANFYFSNTRARNALSGGTGVTYNPTTGSIEIGQSVGTTSDVTFANVTVTGNLLVQGNAIEFSTNTLIINDPLIQLGKNPTGDVVDLGFFGHYIGGSPSIERHAGLFRDATDGQFKLFTNLDPEPVSIVDTANTSYTAANLVVNYVVGRVTDISNHTTSSLTEGANLYFTNTRAIGALTSGAGISIAANGRITSTVTGGGGGGGNVTSVNGLEGVVVLTTANIAEEGNLYFTNTRAVSALTAGLNISIAANGRITGTATGSGSTLGSTYLQLMFLS